MLTDEIQRRLIEAFQVIEHITDSPMPKAFGNGMPDVIRFASADAVYAAQLESFQKDWGFTFRQMQDDRVREFARTARSHYTAAQISQAEEAISWPALVEHPVKREILILFIKCKAKKGVWTEWLTRRNRANPQKYGVSRLNSYRWKAQSLQEIALKLRNGEIMLRQRTG